MTQQDKSVKFDALKVLETEQENIATWLRKTVPDGHEEVLSQIWIRVCKVGNDQQPKTNAKAWIWTIARNEKAEWIRKLLSGPQVSGDLLDGEAGNDNVLDELILREEQQRLAWALGKIAAVDKLAAFTIAGHIYQNLSFKQICERLRRQVKVKDLRPKYEWGLRELRRLLQRTSTGPIHISESPHHRKNVQ